MSCNCQDILNKELCDIPYEWRSQIIDAICYLQEYDYECGKTCQNVTFLSQFRNEKNQVCISYIDEKSQRVERCFDFDLTSTILNNLILPNCVSLPIGVTFKELSFDKKFQHIIDILCQNCCGTPIATTTTTTCGQILSVTGGLNFTTTSSTTTTTTSNTSTTTSSTTTSTTINCCQNSFTKLPLPGQTAIMSNGVSISSSFTVPSTPQSLTKLTGKLCPSCYPCGNYDGMIGTASPIGVVWGPTHPWDFVLNFSQPIKSINLRIFNLSSTEKYILPNGPYVDATLEGIEFTTNVGNPTITVCEGCNVNVQGNKLYCESATINHTGVKNGSGIFRISSNTPFSSLKLTDIRIFTNSSFCYYCGPDYHTSVWIDMCGQVTK